MGAKSFEERVLEVVLAPGTRLERSGSNYGMTVLVNGLTGKDACNRTPRECFEALFEEEDGEMSPGRLGFGLDRETGAFVLMLEAPDAR